VLAYAVALVACLLVLLYAPLLLRVQPPSRALTMAVQMVPPIFTWHTVSALLGFGGRGLDYLYGPKLETFTKSRLEARFLASGAAFAVLVVVAVPALSAVALSFSQSGEELLGHRRKYLDMLYVAPRVLGVAALALPRTAMVISAVLVLRTGDLCLASLRVVPYLHFVKAKRVQERRYLDAFHKSPAEYKDLKMPVEVAQFADFQNWDVFALTAAAAYAPVAPIVSLVAVACLTVSLKALRLNFATCSVAPFDVAGALSRQGLVATEMSLTAAFLLHAAVVVLFGNAFHVLALLAPLFFLARKWAQKRRTAGGPLRPLDLTTARDLDAKRGGGARSCAAFCAADRFWASRVAPPPPSQDFFPGASPLGDEEDLDDRIEAMLTWMDRYDSRTAVPSFFDEDILFKESVLVRIQDQTWRKLNDHRKKRRLQRIRSLHHRELHLQQRHPTDDASSDAMDDDLDDGGKHPDDERIYPEV